MANYQYKMPPVSVQEGNAMPRHWIPASRYDFAKHGIFICVTTSSEEPVSIELQSEADIEGNELMSGLWISNAQQIWGRWRGVISSVMEKTWLGIPKTIDEVVV